MGNYPVIHCKQALSVPAWLRDSWLKAVQRTIVKKLVSCFIISQWIRTQDGYYNTLLFLSQGVACTLGAGRRMAECSTGYSGMDYSWLITWGWEVVLKPGAIGSAHSSVPRLPSSHGRRESSESGHRSLVAAQCGTKNKSSFVLLPHLYVRRNNAISLTRSWGWLRSEYLELRDNCSLYLAQTATNCPKVCEPLCWGRL